jgi:hypothetical protein
MTKKIWQWKAIVLLAAGVTVSMVPAASAATYSLYELHTTGSIWGYTGTACQGGVCGGWAQLDDNPAAIEIVAGGGSLFQLHSNGVVWKFTGTPCSGSYCPGWQEIDNEPNNWVVGIHGAGGTLYEQRKDGSVWTFTGQICNGSNCPGWRQLDNSSQIVSIFGGASGLFEIRLSIEGQNTVYTYWEYLGTPCAGGSCPGWAEIDAGEDGWIAVGSYSAFELQAYADLKQFTGQPCGNNGCKGWLEVDSNSSSYAITAANNLFQLRQSFTTNSIWQYNGTPCGNGCNGWIELDSNPAISYIVAGGNTVYQQHVDGSVWESTGQACGSSGCPGWVQLDNNSLTKSIVAN